MDKKATITIICNNKSVLHKKNRLLISKRFKIDCKINYYFVVPGLAGAGDGLVVP